MNALIDMIKISRDLSENTLKNYGRTLMRLQKMVGIKDIPIFLEDGTLLAKIKTDFKKPYQINLLSSMIVAMSSYIENIPNEIIEIKLKDYRKYQMEIREELDKGKYAQTKSPNEETNWTSYKSLHDATKTNFKAINKIIKRADEIDMKDAKLVMNWVISMLYAGSTQNPPMRLDYNNMIIISKEDYAKEHLEKQNYLVVHSNRTKYFVFAEYKTFKTYGKKSIKLAPGLNRMINKWMQVKNKIRGINSNYLLFNNKGNPVNESSMSIYMSDAFAPTGKHITANLIRHIFISDIVNKLALTDRKKISDQMCHSLEMSLCYEKND